MRDGGQDEEGKLVCFQDEPETYWQFSVDPKLTGNLGRLSIYDKYHQRLLPYRTTIDNKGTVFIFFTRKVSGTAIFMSNDFIQKTILRDEIWFIEEEQESIQP